MDYTISTTWMAVLAVLAIWELTWKGIALWRAGRNNQLGWFIALLVINTAGILPIIYLLSQQSLIKEKEESHETTVPFEG